MAGFVGLAEFAVFVGFAESVDFVVFVDFAEGYLRKEVYFHLVSEFIVQIFANLFDLFILKFGISHLDLSNFFLDY